VGYLDVEPRRRPLPPHDISALMDGPILPDVDVLEADEETDQRARTVEREIGAELPRDRRRSEHGRRLGAPGSATNFMRSHDPNGRCHFRRARRLGRARRRGSSNRRATDDAKLGARLVGLTALLAFTHQ
jgi:hypothetical protein